MEKYLKYIVLGFGIVFITIGIVYIYVFDYENSNISSEVIECSISDTADTGIIYGKKYVMEFYDNKLKKYSYISSYQYDEKSEEWILRDRDSIKKRIALAENYDGISVNSIDKDNILINTYIYELERINMNVEDENNMLPDYFLNMAREDIIKKLEGYGLTCKNVG